jgi:hypothetical protein
MLCRRRKKRVFSIDCFGVEEIERFLEQMARSGTNVMGMDPAVLLDQLRFGGGFGSVGGNNTNNNDSNGGRGFDIGRMFQEWGAGPFASRRSSSSGLNNNSNNSNNETFNQIRPGTPIVIQHLVNSPHLNGQHAKIQQYTPSTGRYVIQLDSNNTTMALKPINLLQRLTVKIFGLVSQPQFNGREGTIVSYNKERERYVVRVAYLPSETKEISIKPCNMRIPDLAKVRLEGLENQSRWNGRYGEVLILI